MNKDRIEGSWRRVKGSLQQRWGEWVRDEQLVSTGRREQRLGKRQLRLGLAKDAADQQVQRWRM